MLCCTYFNLKEYSRFAMQVRGAVIPNQAGASEASSTRMGKAGKGLNGFCLSTSHHVPVWMQLSPLVAAFITMSSDLRWKHLFLCTYHPPIMFSCVLSCKRRGNQDDLSFLCHSIMFYLVVSYQEGEDDDAPAHLLLPPDAAVSDPHCRRPEDRDKMSQHNW